jgi:hypothetical protein
MLPMHICGTLAELEILVDQAQAQAQAQAHQQQIAQK